MNQNDTLSRDATNANTAARTDTARTDMGRTDTTRGSGMSDRSRDLERDETTNLISSDKVDGTVVYATDGDKIGTVSHLMIGKRSGRVEYAVMSFGGFLGMGERYHPLPWDALDYDTSRGGYVVGIDKNRLKDAPSYERNREPTYDRQYGESVHNYYGTTY